MTNSQFGRECVQISYEREFTMKQQLSHLDYRTMSFAYAERNLGCAKKMGQLHW